MRVYTYSEARQSLATLLDVATRDGAVAIRRGDGQTFILSPQSVGNSDLDVEGIDLGITTEEIVDIVRQGRER